jgi:hypothetical protein
VLNRAAALSLQAAACCPHCCSMSGLLRMSSFVTSRFCCVGFMRWEPGHDAVLLLQLMESMPGGAVGRNPTCMSCHPDHPAPTCPTRVCDHHQRIQQSQHHPAKHSPTVAVATAVAVAVARQGHCSVCRTCANTSAKVPPRSILK